MKTLLAAVLLAAAGAAPAPSPSPAAPLSLDAAPSRYASYGGFPIHYKSIGSGPDAVVFIHGLSCDLTSWRFQVPALAGRTRIVLVDLPGHGKSDRSGGLTYSLQSHAMAVDAVLRDAGVRRAVLVGHSMGTPVARAFYRLFPGRVAALVAVDGALKAMMTDAAAIENFVAPYRGPDFAARMEKFADSMLPAPGAAAWREDIRRGMLSTPQAVVVRSMEGMLDPAAWKDDAIRVPLLCVVAKNAFWSPEYEAYVRALGPDVEYRVLEGTGHFLMLEKPDAFNAILREFLAKHRLLPS